MRRETAPRTAPSVPAPGATYDEKRAYYKSQHTSRGVRMTHLVGIPAIAASIPLFFVKPKAAFKLFLAGWALQIFGHAVYEKNSPALKNGPLSYQFVGLGYWAEEMTDLVARFNRQRGWTEGPTAGTTHETEYGTIVNLTDSATGT